jgi:hypothetical protein
MSLILDEVIKDLHRQEMKGLNKYGATLDKEHTELYMIKNAYEEALDLAMYLKKLIQIKENNQK